MPKYLRVALWANLILLAVALIAPRLFISDDAGLDAATAAAMFFVIPMAAIFGIGAGAVLYAYLAARERKQRIHWTAFLPLSVFLLGFVLVLLMVLLQNG